MPPIVQQLIVAAAGSKKALLFRFWWLWLGLVILGVLLIGIIGALGSGRRRAAKLTGRSRRRRAIKDAWVEAGKRAEPEPVEPDDEDAEPDEP